MVDANIEKTHRLTTGLTGRSGIKNKSEIPLMGLEDLVKKHEKALLRQDGLDTSKVNDFQNSANAFAMEYKRYIRDGIALGSFTEAEAQKKIAEIRKEYTKKREEIILDKKNKRKEKHKENLKEAALVTVGCLSLITAFAITAKEFDKEVTQESLPTPVPIVEKYEEAQAQDNLGLVEEKQARHEANETQKRKDWETKNGPSKGD